MQPITVVDDLLAGTEPVEGKLGHSTALKSADVRVIVLSFPAGHVMREHSAPKTLLMQALDGHVRVTGAETTVDLRPGVLIRFDAGVRHEVEAVEPTRLMLTLIG